MLVRLTIKMLGALPLAVRARLGNALGRLVGLFPTRDRRVAALQLQAFFPDDAAPPTLGAIYGNLGETFMESINLAPLLAPGQRSIEVPSGDFVKALRECGRPVLALTAHLSNWDLLAAFVFKQGMPLSTVGRRARNAALQDALAELRASNGVRTIWRDDPGSAKELIRALKPGALVAALIDQDTTVAGKHSLFFGEPAHTPHSLVELARRHGARIITAFIVRTARLHFKILVDEVPTELGTDDVLQRYHRNLESAVRLYPSQWVWVHKRWRTLPDGRRLSSGQYFDFLKAKAAARRRQAGVLREHAK
jgi:Kdo2-lipid IVA lauroyltransferase/acyltransferase